MKLPPKATRYLSQFASSLNDAIRNVAQDAGVLDDYSNAVDHEAEQSLGSQQGTGQAASHSDSDVDHSRRGYGYAIRARSARNIHDAPSRSAQRLVKPSTGATRSSTSCHRSP
jgi:hypothetical protein